MLMASTLVTSSRAEWFAGVATGCLKLLSLFWDGIQSRSCVPVLSRSFTASEIEPDGVIYEIQFPEAYDLS